MKEAWGNNDVTRSFSESTDHLTVPSDVGYNCVFIKTSFVVAQLQLISERAGHEAELQDFARLRKSQFTAFIYLMEDLRNGLFKIGRSLTPSKREQTLQSEAPDVLLRVAIPADQEHETELHRQFVSKRVRGEWFRLGVDDVLRLVSFLKENGDGDRAKIDYQWLGTIFFKSSGTSKTQNQAGPESPKP